MHGDTQAKQTPDESLKNWSGHVGLQRWLYSQFDVMQLTQLRLSKHLLQGETQFWQTLEPSGYVPSGQITSQLKFTLLKYFKAFGLGKQLMHLVGILSQALQGELQKGFTTTPVYKTETLLPL